MQFFFIQLQHNIQIMDQVTPVLFASAMVAAGYLNVLCVTPPNLSPEEKDRHKNDNMSFMAGKFIVILRRVTLATIIYHALLTVISHTTTARTLQICPQWQSINPELFTWSGWSITSLLIIYIGAYIRLSAFGGLGKYFTFHLATPDRLVTTGIYKWVQHPSYTGVLLVQTGLYALFLRWDAAPACWFPEWALSGLQGWGLSAAVAVMGASLWGMRLRVVDEENMLRQKFGAEWENWHRSTSRFIPGLF